jgi:hypothetical protein
MPAKRREAASLPALMPRPGPMNADRSHGLLHVKIGVMGGEPGTSHRRT